MVALAALALERQSLFFFFFLLPTRLQVPAWGREATVAITTHPNFAPVTDIRRVIHLKNIFSQCFGPGCHVVSCFSQDGHGVAAVSSVRKITGKPLQGARIIPIVHNHFVCEWNNASEYRCLSGSPAPSSHSLRFLFASSPHPFFQPPSFHLLCYRSSSPPMQKKIRQQGWKKEADNQSGFLAGTSCSVRLAADRRTLVQGCA